MHGLASPLQPKSGSQAPWGLGAGLSLLGTFGQSSCPFSTGAHQGYGLGGTGQGQGTMVFLPRCWLCCCDPLPWSLVSPAQTDCADFQTAKSISAAPASAGGSDLNVEVTFEPCHLGEAKATLQLSSAVGGQYCIPLIGLALPPEPQGPFLIPAGGTTSISFRNVFPKATAFQYAVKHPAFTVRAPAMLRARSSATITVSFTGGPAPVTSRLVVSCPGGSWIYHLRGLPSTRK